MHSAYGISVVHQMAAYGGREEGLFRGAIVDSGMFTNMNSSLDSLTPTWEACASLVSSSMSESSSNSLVIT
jgi:hypothetical protein